MAAVDFVPNTITIPVMWLTALRANPAGLEAFLGLCRNALSIQQQSMATPADGRAPKADEELPLTKAPPELKQPELGAYLTESLATDFPNAMAPTSTQVAELRSLTGTAPVTDVVADILTVLSRIVAKRPPNYIGHVAGILSSLRRDGYEQLHNEAAAIRRSGAVDVNVARQQANQRLEREVPAPPPATGLEALMALRRRDLIDE